MYLVPTKANLVEKEYSTGFETEDQRNLTLAAGNRRVEKCILTYNGLQIRFQGGELFTHPLAPSPQASLREASHMRGIKQVKPI
jgi:hypothetical protein